MSDPLSCKPACREYGFQGPNKIRRRSLRSHECEASDVAFMSMILPSPGSRLEAMAIRLKAIVSRLDWRPLLLG